MDYSNLIYENNMKKQYVIGVDMGGTNTAFGIVDTRGSILFRDLISTAAYSTGEAYVEALGNAINKLIADSGMDDQIKGIGIGAPNGNYYNGTLEDAANVPWAKNKVVPLAKMIAEKTNLPCTLTNDANAAAIGEMAYGVAKGMKDFMVITLGTGVGSGIVCNGQLVLGQDSYAGELGHITMIRYNGRPCGCGRTGCLETYASASGVARTAREFLEIKNDIPSTLREIEDRPITSKDVFEAAEKGDKIAIDIFNYTGAILGEAFANFVCYSTPEAIILFGGLAHAGDYLLDPLKEALDKNVMDIFKGNTKILLSALNDAEAAILGASALAWE